MTSIQEGRQHLHFDRSWMILKWDQSAEFIGSMDGAMHQLADGVKAVDVIGVREIRHRPRMLLIAEFKDFSHPDIPASKKAEVARSAISDQLMRNIVRKVIDSLSGATFAHDSDQRRCAELTSWRPALGRRTTTMLVLLCIEVPRSQSIAALAWTKQLQQRLRWLGPDTRVIVTSSARPFSGDGVRYEV